MNNLNTNFDEIKLTLYLAGWSQETVYRNYVEAVYGELFNLLNPMTITRDMVMEGIGKNEYDTYIIRRDKKMILQSDILIAYISDHGPSWGTTSEIMFAYCNGIPVYVIDITEGMKHANDPWIKFHTKMRFKTIDECFNYILNK